MKLLSAREIENLYKIAEEEDLVHRYRKISPIQYREAIPGEKIITTISGKKETENVAKKTDIIIKNPSGEEYIIPLDKFKTRYDFDVITPEYRKALPISQCYGFQYYGKSFEFIAPWKEKMLVETGDYIVSSEKSKYDDIYRIEKNVFEDTYKRCYTLFVGLVASNKTAKLLIDWSKSNNVSTKLNYNGSSLNKPFPYHITLVYGDIQESDEEEIREYFELFSPIELIPSKFNFLGENKDILVVNIHDDDRIIEARNKIIERHNLKFTYNEYRPHMTLSYDKKIIDISKLTKIDFPLIFNKLKIVIE